MIQTKQLLAHAAEAKIYLVKEVEYQGNLVPYIVKDRISKGYRHPILDKKIIKQRTKREASILEKANKLIPTPLPIEVTESKIIMPYIEGKKLSDNLEQLNWKSICKTIGNQIAKLHDNNIIHGDLTTSNMIYVDNSNNSKDKQNPSMLKQAPSDKLKMNNKSMLKPTTSNDLTINNKIKREAEQEEASSNKRAEGEPKLYFIDFGLSFTSTRIEDKAVDLHLIKQALEAKHFSIHKEAEKIILDNYNSKDKTRVLEQLKKVEARGRYRKNAA
jgi:TP53 regulating kinase-like protein